MLAVSGRLNLKAGGPSVMVPVDPDLVNLLYTPSQWAVTPDRTEHDRRSVYLIAKRNLRLPFMEVFDQPDAADELPAPRVEHARAAGAGAAQRHARRTTSPSRSPPACATRPGATPRRRSTWRTGSPPAARRRAKEQQLALEFLKTQPLQRVRPGDVQPERVPVRELTDARHIRTAPAASSSRDAFCGFGALALASLCSASRT